MRYQTLFIIMIALLIPGLTALAPQVAAQEGPQLTPTALASERPDSCERNDTPDRPCVLELDAVSGPFTFLPDGDQDYYSLDLGAQPGLVLSVAVRSTAGLDLLTTIRRAGSDETLTTIASPAISTTLSANLSGWLVLRVENRSPQVASGESYSIELRRSLPPPPPAIPQSDVGAAPLEPDRLENNWSPATAGAIGIGSVYDLNFACPVAWGCAGGDHDYLAVPVKAGTDYLFATFDLGPGVDTVVDIFWGEAQEPLLSNDDAYPGVSFLSVVRWRAPADGLAIVRVGPRTGGLIPQVFDEDASTYRFAAVLAASDLARQIEERIAGQVALPSPTARPVRDLPPAPPAGVASAAAPAPQPTPAADAPKGSAVVSAELTMLREGPAAGAAALQELPRGTELTLLGQALGAWVRVQAADSVVPGWVYGPDLRRVAGEGASSTATATPPVTGVTATPLVSAAPPQLRVRALEPAPPPPAPTAAPNRRIVLTVSIEVGASAAESTYGAPTSTPASQQTLVGMRVQLVNAFGDLLAEALTDARGQVTLSRDLAPLNAAYLRVPALGIALLVDEMQPTLRIRLPKGETQ